jgi:hypothetical protein
VGFRAGVFKRVVHVRGKSCTLRARLAFLSRAHREPHAGDRSTGATAIPSHFSFLISSNIAADTRFPVLIMGKT